MHGWRSLIESGERSIRRMKTVILMPLGEQRGGGEMMLLELLRNSEATGIEWVLIVFEDGPLVAQARSLGVETIVVPAGRLRQLRRYFRTVNIIARTARTADVVFSWMPKAHLYGGPGALAARKPTIWFQLSVPSRLNWMDRLATFIPARGILTLSVAADDAQRQLWPARRTRMVYPSVDLERFRARDAAERAQARQLLGLEESWPVLGIVARLQRWKGIHRRD